MIEKITIHFDTDFQAATDAVAPDDLSDSEYYTVTPEQAEERRKYLTSEGPIETLESMLAMLDAEAALDAVESGEADVNLSAAEEMFNRIDAGGPGSGCHGDNCGRPAGAGGEGISKAYADNLSKAKALLEKYAADKEPEYQGHVKLPNKTMYNKDRTNRWMQRLEEGQPREEAAKGLGLYVELANSMGLGPKHLQAVAKYMDDWTNESDAGGGKYVQEKGQEIVDGHCCSDARAKAMMVEYLITQAKLEKKYPSGMIPVLYRGVYGDHAAGLKDQASMARTKEVSIRTRGAESFSASYEKAKDFADSHEHGVVIEEHNVPITHVISSFDTSPGYFAGLADEREYVLSHPGAGMKVPKQHIKDVSMYGD